MNKLLIIFLFLSVPVVGMDSDLAKQLSFINNLLSYAHTKKSGSTMLETSRYKNGQYTEYFLSLPGVVSVKGFCFNGEPQEVLLFNAGSQSQFPEELNTETLKPIIQWFKSKNKLKS